MNQYHVYLYIFTYLYSQLTQHLLANDKPTINRFTKADQNLIASTFEQIRSRHASTVENLAEIVIGLRRISSSIHSIFHTSTSTNISTNTNTDPPLSPSPLSGDPIIGQDLIDSFLKERLGLQLICDHYVALSKYDTKTSSSRSVGGGVSVDCNFVEVNRIFLS